MNWIQDMLHTAHCTLYTVINSFHAKIELENATETKTGLRPMYCTVQVVKWCTVYTVQCSHVLPRLNPIIHNRQCNTYNTMHLHNRNAIYHTKFHYVFVLCQRCCIV